MDLSYWRELLRPTFTGRKVIIALQVAGGATQFVREVLELGATGVLVIATNGRGLGPQPTEVGAQLIELNTPTDGTMLGSIRACQQAIRSLPENVVDQINEFDPEGTSVALGDFLNENEYLAGRRFVFHRRPEWIALDDKTTIDSLWDRAGIERGPSLVVDVTLQAITEAFTQLDRGDGVVVSIDSQDGWTGGGEGVRRIPTLADLDLLIDEGWRQSGRRCRVMPFIEGIPCSIHGVVFDDFVAAFRPMEMVVLRRANGSFFYTGCASYFDPPAADREAMRDVAKRVGALLRDEVGLRGAFTVDGIMSAEGFRPTELNPRNGAGLITMMRAFPDQPTMLVVDCIAAGITADWKPDEFERVLLNGFDDRRSGGTWRSFSHAEVPPPQSGRLSVTTDRVAFVEEDHPADLTFGAASSPESTFFRASWVADQTPVGPPTADRAAAFWNWADNTYGLGIGPLSPARSVR